MNSAKSEHGGRFFGKTRRILTALLLDVMLMTLLVSFISADTTYVITDGDTVTTVRSYADNVPAALTRAGITLTPTDRVYTWSTDRTLEVEVQRGSRVTLRYDGTSITVIGYDSETVQQLIQRVGVTLGPDDQVSIDRQQGVDQTMDITITRRTVTYETVTEAIPYTVRRVADETALLGTEQVQQEGADGQVTYTWRVTTIENGEPVRVLAEQKVDREAVEQVISYGTRVEQVALNALSVTTDTIVNIDENGEGGVLTTASGEKLAYSKVLSCTATAYTCEGKRWRTTATGTAARVGAVAVDPQVIPYHTRMFIITDDGSIVYGVATAEDCGSGVNGNAVDLYFDTYRECINFGRRPCTVYILE